MNIPTWNLDTLEWECPECGEPGPSWEVAYWCCQSPSGDDPRWLLLAQQQGTYIPVGKEN